MKTKALWIFVLCALLLLGACSALADGQEGAYQDSPPPEVLSHLQDKYSDWLLEDYVKISGTPKGDYGFALVVKKGSRRLLGYHLEGGRMVYWLRNDAAAPQGEAPVQFLRHNNNTYWDEGKTFGNSLGFTVYRLDSAAQEYVHQQVVYHWENGGFKLMSYRDRDYDWINCIVDDQGVRYREFLAGERTGYVPGVLQRDLRYVSFDALPRTIRALQDSLSHAPTIPQGELSAQKVRFTGGRKYPVYSAPSETSLRGGKGKALVSTNDWIQVFGQDKGFILIQYDITRDHMRFGYIDAAALPKNTQVKALNFSGRLMKAKAATPLTDDPLNSRAALGSLAAGQDVVQLATMGAWVYVETTLNGLAARGFVPAGSLEEGIQATFPPVQSGTVGQIYSGRYQVGGQQATITVNLSPDQSQYELVVFLEQEAVLAGQQAAPLPLCFHLMADGQSQGKSQAPDTNGGTAAYLLVLPVSPPRDSIIIAPEYAGSGIALDQALTLPLR